MSHHAEAKVIRDEVGPRDEEQDARRDEAERVDHQPESVLFEIPAEMASEKSHRLVLFEIVGKEEAGIRLAAQVPQQTLFRDALGDVAKAARPRPPEHTARFVGAVTVAPFALGLREDRTETRLQPADEAGIRRGTRLIRLVRHFAI